MNWKVRLKNKYFWLAFIPAVLLLVQLVLKCFGVTIDVNELEANLLAVINAVFGVLSIIGIVNDPTTADLTDSTQAMGYDEPKKDE